jgi:hypothetical protein
MLRVVLVVARTLYGSAACATELLLEVVRQHGAGAEAERHEHVFGRRR